MAVENSVCANLCSHVNCKVPAAVLCLLCIIAQGAVLNFYLATYISTTWWAWTAADVVIVAVFIGTFLKAFRSMSAQTHMYDGRLPLGYVAWLVYSVLFAARVYIIFERIAPTLKEEFAFGPNTLKTTVAGSCFIFLLLVTCHHKTSSETQKSQAKFLSHSVTLNILDTVTILDILFMERSHVMFSFAMHKTINVIGCINLVLPVLPLLVISNEHLGEEGASKKVKILHTVVNLLVLNLPLFIIRLLLWNLYTRNISVFIIKNVLGIVFTCADLWESCLKPHDIADGTAKELQPTEEEMGTLQPAVMPPTALLPAQPAGDNGKELVMGETAF